jgi:1-acyl-sn-glycerol-3-phosphate acyltransferase
MWYTIPAMKAYFLPPLILQKLIWIPTRLVLVFFGHLKVKGLENVRVLYDEPRRPVIFACNHGSEIDPFMVPASLPFFSRFSPLFYAVREKSFYEGNGWRKHFFNGWFINLWGGYSATVGLHDYGRSLEQHIVILREGGSFCVFPEGSITRDGNIQPAKGGISYLAHSSPCSVIPVAISGVHGMSPLDFLRGKRRITVSFGKPIPSAELYKDHLAPHDPEENLWKKEAEFVMKKVGEMVENTPSYTQVLSKM